VLFLPNSQNTVQKVLTSEVEKKALLDQDRNLSRKRLRRESLRSSLSVWDGGDDND